MKIVMKKVITKGPIKERMINTCNFFIELGI